MDQEQQSRWRPTRRQLLWASGIVAVLTVSVLIGYRYGITLWDWLKLLVVPAVLAGGGLWYNAQQRAHEEQIANERAQDEALQAYLEGLSGLITDKDRPLRRAQLGDSLSSVARARTLTVLLRLDGPRKGQVVQFLYEAGLIAKDRRVLDLNGADLTEANLFQANLREADLNNTSLIRAQAYSANLHGANLRGALLWQAELKEADLSDANVSDTVLVDADLSEANLRDARVTNAQLAEARSLKGATMPNGQKVEDWLKDKENHGEDE